MTASLRRPVVWIFLLIASGLSVFLVLRYFGDAFFNQALRRTNSVPQAFEDARAIVAARESAQGYDPSNPQIAGGENVIEALAQGR